MRVSLRFARTLPLLLASLLVSIPASAAQVLETVRDQVLILREPDESALPAETADQGEIYQGSDRSYRGFFKVVLKKKDPAGSQSGPQFGWIPVDSVRSADPAKVAALSKPVSGIQRSLFSAEFGFTLSSYAPTAIQTALGLESSRVLGAGFSLAGAYRATRRLSLVLQGSTFGIGESGTPIVNFTFSGKQLAGFLEYDVYSDELYAVTLGLGGGWMTAQFQSLMSSGATYSQPSFSAGFWNPRIGIRRSFTGVWSPVSVVLRVSRQFVTETQQPFYNPAPSLDLSSLQFQTAAIYAF